MARRLNVPVSVVVPCWRCEETVVRAIESIRAQTVVPVEIILIDDGSEDGTFRELERLAGTFFPPVRVRLIKSPLNCGAGSARNLGWQIASQKYVAFLDADDSWHPRKLELQFSLMELHPAINLSGHLHTLLIDSTQQFPAYADIVPHFVVFDFSNLLWRNRFITSSVMLRRAVSARFAPLQRYMEDHRLWLEVAYAGGFVLRMELKLAAHHKLDFGSSGLSAQLWSMHLAELNNYTTLLRQGRISGLKCALLLMWSMLKFTRRIFIFLGRKLRLWMV